MKIPIVFVVISFILFYMVLPCIVWLCARKTKLGKAIVVVCSILFGIVLFFGITSKVSITENCVIVNFDYTNKWFGKPINLNVFDIDKIDFIINISMLVPIGLVVIYFNKRKLPNKLLMLTLIGLMIGLALETLQYILPVYRTVQLSDVVLNTVSVVIGGCVGLIYDLIVNKIRKVNRGEK